MPRSGRHAVFRLANRVLGDSRYSAAKSAFFELRFRVRHPLRAVSTPIVVDLGCYSHPGEESIAPLVERFRPSVLYGFDPLLGLPEQGATMGGSRVVLSGRAAWVHDGTLELRAGTDGHEDESTVMRERHDRGAWAAGFDRREVPCFDFPVWLEGLPRAKLVVKMDVEGAEYPLLERMIERGVDGRVSELFVEWHDLEGARERRDEILRRLRCGRVHRWHEQGFPP